LDEDQPATGDVAPRGIPIGLMHAVGRFDPDALRQEAEVVTRLSHGSLLAIAATTATAFLVRLAVRKAVPRAQWAQEAARFIGAGAVADQLQRTAEAITHGMPVLDAIEEIGTGVDAASVVATACLAAATAGVFEEAVIAAVNAGGATDTRGALAGALAGAYFGASGIPQPLIDELEGRIYLSLAAPWFFRTAQRRAGLLIHLREVR
jgi:ADP-ribosylglycohydrolase